MDIENTKITMSLKDYNELRAYEKWYKTLSDDIQDVTYIDSLTNDEAIIVIDKKKAENLIVPFSAEDCELDGYEDKIKVVWT